jgi:hypothetical protein
VIQVVSSIEIPLPPPGDLDGPPAEADDDPDDDPDDD